MRALALQLAACRAESWSVVAKAVAADLEVRSAARPRASAGSDEDPILAMLATLAGEPFDDAIVR